MQKILLPSWVSSAIFSLLQKYLTSRSLDFYRDYNEDTALLIQTLRLTDYLGMYKFQERFISEVITPSISVTNCVVFLEETHRKLKNQENGSQCWYSLLNASITFLALNIREVYKISSEKLKRLHEKILNEILDRSIRNGNVDEEMIFELIMESRKAANVENLCQVLRGAI
jgi:MFS superfamily sulfate permease-like transporter